MHNEYETKERNYIFWKNAWYLALNDWLKFDKVAETKCLTYTKLNRS